MRTEAFTRAYEKLNTAQRTAVDTVEGPVMVIAGPGTGKTQILTLRIANILLKTHAEPENILALTFTEAAASEMRRRLANTIGPRAYGVHISTFHGFCNEVIRSYPDQFREIVGRKPSDEAAQVRLIQEAIDRKGTDGKLRPLGDPAYYVSPVKSAISALKREGVAPRDLRLRIEARITETNEREDLRHTKGAHAGKIKAEYEKKLGQYEKSKELADAYEEYEALLAAEKLYDYDDMVMRVMMALEEDDLVLRLLQEQYQYFLVDEHQDTNSAQNRILELLANFHANPNVFVVGDEKQAIFRFQGASLANFLYFKERYPEAQLITLTENYRSSQSILDAAGSMISGNAERISDVLQGFDGDLLARSGHEAKPIEIFELEKADDELCFVAKRAGELVRAGVDPRQIAVLYRDNRDIQPFARIFEKHGIPFKVESKRNVLEDPGIRNILTLLRFVSDLGSDEALFNVLHIDFLGLEPLDIYKVNRIAVEKRKPLIEIMAWEKLLEEAGIESAGTFKKLAGLFSEWRKIALNDPVTELFEHVVRDSGCLDAALASADPALRINRINTLFNEIKAMVEANPHISLTETIARFALLESQGIPLKEGAETFVPEAVRCMTAHGAKGLEFEHVFVVNAYDGHWGNKRTREMFPLADILGADRARVSAALKNDDERRLMYVAITRAKKHVHISYARIGSDGREQLPSQFIEEMDPRVRMKGDAAPYTMGPEEQARSMFAPRKTSRQGALEKAYIGHLFAERGLSATALNNFLSCPWKYVYMNLLRMPKAPSIPQVYGVAVHAAMRAHFDALSLGTAEKELFIKTFEETAQGTILAREENLPVIEKGRKALSGYYDHYNGAWFTETKNEVGVRGIVLSGKNGLPDIELTGKIDKIEFLPDGAINVVDYKTGRPKSRNELEGKTKDSSGDYKRQLVFYKLLLDNFGIYRDRMRTAEIDFVEPMKSGQYRKEKFEVDAKDAEELKEVIYGVADAIMSMSFWDHRCGDPECEFCRLRDRMV